MAEAVFLKKIENDLTSTYRSSSSWVREGEPRYYIRNTKVVFVVVGGNDDSCIEWWAVQGQTKAGVSSYLEVSLFVKTVLACAAGEFFELAPTQTVVYRQMNA